jgi:hypothetical protein
MGKASPDAAQKTNYAAPQKVKATAKRHFFFFDSLRQVAGEIP